jgi:lambda family phage portal protein
MEGPRLNLLDKAVAYFSPRQGLRRRNFRAAAELLSAYEGAMTGRRTEGWVTGGSDANSALGMDLARLRDRSRDLVRNTPEGKRIKKTIVTSTVGAGIVPEADTGDKGLNAEIDAAFRRHLEECDADGQLDYYGLQSLAVSGIFESGEVLVRKRNRRMSDGLTAPVQYQLLESDHLDSNATYNTHGGVTVQGVERDAIGKRAGYWLFPVHPGAASVAYNLSDGYTSKFYDASGIIHAYQKDDSRPGQERGVPWLHPIIMLMRTMDEYNVAELVRARTASCLSVIMEQNEDPGGIGATLGVASTEAETGDRIEKLRPGSILYAKPGQKASVITPPGHANFAEFQTHHQHRLASGVGMFYAQLTGDLSSVNWSSFRAGDRDFRGVIESFRWLCVIPMLLQPMWRWFIDAAYLSGAISRIDYGVAWTPPQFMSVNPVSDAQADELELANGTLDWGEAVRRRGVDPEKQYQTILGWKQRMEKDGLVMAWDRSKVDGKGAIQAESDTILNGGAK